MSSASRMLRSARADLHDSHAYLPALFVLIGAALALALGVADFTLLVLAVDSEIPAWAVVLIGIIIVAGPLSVGALRATRQVEGVAAQTLLVVSFAGGPPGPAVGWSQRWRTLAWFLLHLGVGSVVVAAVIGDVALSASWWTVPAAVATVVGVVILGRLMASLAPVLLGPSFAERLAAAAARATERNRIARELHDSIGHALSLVNVQASAARKVLGRDPSFAEQALATIETASRQAVVDLDHMLGLLRDDPNRAATRAPIPDLDNLNELIDAARTAGLTVHSSVSGALSALPVLVSQEAYRIIQEGLTNALKYATDATVTLRLFVDGRVVCIELSNTAVRRLRNGGRGLQGIRERAATLGGSAHAGVENGQWTLAVTIPIRELRP